MHGSGTHQSFTWRARLLGGEKSSVAGRSATSMRATRGPSLKLPIWRLPGSLVMTPRMTKRHLANGDRVANVHRQRREQAPDARHAAVFQHGVRVGLAAL